MNKKKFKTWKEIDGFDRMGILFTLLMGIIATGGIIGNNGTCAVLGTGFFWLGLVGTYLTFKND